MALSLGAAGFIPKSSSLDVMVEALACLIAGGVFAPSDADDALDATGARIAALTHAQQRVLVGLQRGLLNKQIAYDLGVTEATVKAHLTAIFRKLGVQSRTQAVILAKQSLSGDGG
jgi:DNA-binding NarL/FixJ family response regulator